MNGGFANMNGGGFASKPRALMCYICGREYGTTSLQIHLKTCMKKWEIEENKKPKRERRPMPQPPQQLTNVLDKINGGGGVNWAELDSYNNKANDEYNDSALIRCEYCNRTFLPDRLPIHRKICTPEKPFKPLPPSGGAGTKAPEPTYSPAPTSKAGPSGNSYRAGGGVGGGASGGGYADDKYSMPSSTKASSTKPTTQSSKPSTTQARPTTQSKAQPARQQYQEEEEEEDFYKPAKANIAAKKQAAYGGASGGYGGAAMGGEYSNVQLVPCDICGRTFAADRLDRHMKACTKVQKGEAKHAKKVAVAQKKQLENEKFIAKESKFKKNNWREQHNEFVANLKYNRKLKAVEDRGGDVRSLGPAPEMKAMQSNLVDCPYCTRRFNPQVAERHIPACKNIINKPKPVPGKGAASRTSAQPSYGSPPSKVGGASKGMGAPSYGNSAYGGNSYGGANSYGGNSYGGNQYDDYESSYNAPSYGRPGTNVGLKSNVPQRATGTSVQGKATGSQYGGMGGSKTSGYGASGSTGMNSAKGGLGTQSKVGQYGSPAAKKPTGSRYY